MNILVRLLVLFLCTEKYEIHCEVVAGFTNCMGFFYKLTPPILPLEDTELDLVDICQTLSGTVYFATKYSRVWRIPLYSAYELPEPERYIFQTDGTIKTIKECGQKQDSGPGTWFVEKQVRV